MARLRDSRRDGRVGEFTKPSLRLFLMSVQMMARWVSAVSGVPDALLSSAPAFLPSLSSSSPAAAAASWSAAPRPPLSQPQPPRTSSSDRPRPSRRPLRFRSRGRYSMSHSAALLPLCPPPPMSRVRQRLMPPPLLRLPLLHHRLRRSPPATPLSVVQLSDIIFHI